MAFPEAQTSKSEEHKIAGSENKVFWWVTRGNNEQCCYHFHSLIPGLESGLWKKKHNTVGAVSDNV
jgi:hypothetical protein